MSSVVMRRTREDIERDLDRIVAYVSAEGALSAVELSSAKRLNVPRRHLERPIRLGLSNGRLVSGGQRKWMKYAKGEGINT